jgi:sugar phosphate isomerase/epimerase
VKFAVCNEMYQDWEWPAVCRSAADIGYDGIEIAPFTLGERPSDLSGDDRARVRRAASDAGLEIVGLHWLLVKPEGLYINHPDHDIRTRTRQHLEDLVHLCADLGGRVMVVGSPKQRSVVEGLAYEQAWDLARQTLGAVTRVAEQHDVTLCLEPLGPQETDFINTAAEAVRLVEEIDSPSFQLLLDVKAMATEGRPVADIIRANADHLRHVHANDANRRGPGMGDTDFAPIAQALREIGYDGYVSVEVFEFDPGPEQIASESLASLKRTFGA